MQRIKKLSILRKLGEDNENQIEEEEEEMVKSEENLEIASIQTFSPFL